MSELKQAFDAGKMSVGKAFKFNGCEISTTMDNTDLSMGEYSQNIYTVTLPRSPKHEIEFLETKAEENEYHSLSGTLMFLVNGVLP